MSENKKTNSTDIDSNKALAAISYIWILFLIPLFLKRDSTYVQHHAKQGLVLFIIEVIISFVMWFPIIGQVLFLAALITSIIGFIKAINGELWEAPILYNWSKKIKI